MAITIRHKKSHKRKTSYKKLLLNRTKKKLIKTKKKIFRGGEKRKREEEVEVCAICLEELNNPDNPDITLSCRHTFHRSCIINVCRHNHDMNSDCFCPLCRTLLTPQDLNSLEIEPLPPQQQQQQQRRRLRLPPNLDNIDEFGRYINNQLRAPTRNPLEKLQTELNEFLGTDRLPYELFTDIMEFELQQIGPLSRYRFIRMVRQRDVPRNPVINKKYFKFINYETAVNENIFDVNVDENLDDVDAQMYAYNVYNIL